MQPRLPTPGSDNGNWGDLLNEYLRVSHAENGSLKNGVVKAPQLGLGSVTAPALGSSSVGTGALADGSVVEGKLADGSVSEAKIADGVVSESKLTSELQGRITALRNELDSLQLELTGKIGSDDARLSDARTPTAHAASHATGGSDVITPGDIGAQPAATGTPDGTKFLRDDGVWAVPASSSNTEAILDLLLSRRQLPSGSFQPIPATGGHAGAYSMSSNTTNSYGSPAISTFMVRTDGHHDACAVRVATPSDHPAGANIIPVIYDKDFQIVGEPLPPIDITTSGLSIAPINPHLYLPRGLYYAVLQINTDDEAILTGVNPTFYGQSGTLGLGTSTNMDNNNWANVEVRASRWSGAPPQTLDWGNSVGFLSLAPTTLRFGMRIA